MSATAADLALADELELEASLPTPGEKGEKGENPRQRWIPGGRTRGEDGRTRGESEPEKPTKTAMLERAQAALRPAAGSNAADYPLDALGPLAGAARAIADGAQVRPALAGQSVLCVAALLTQERADVMTLAGPKPLSLFALTIADSGDGKTTADSAAQHAVRERQRADAKRFRNDVDAFEAAGKKDRPEPPREPYRVMGDATVEGIRRAFVQGRAAQGAFSSEAASILAGYGMGPEHRAKTAATLNGLWDCGEVSVSRGTTGRVQLYDRRLSVHWLIQPAAVEDVLSDPVLSDMGFWPRFLVAWPEPAAPRSARPWDMERDTRLGAFWARCTELMDGAEREDCSGLPRLRMDSKAQGLLGAYFERMERAAKGTGAKLGEIKPFAVRASEQAARIAGVLAAFGDLRAIDADTMRGALALSGYALDTWRSIFGDREHSQSCALAMRLFEWMLGRADWSASETAILRTGPKALRSRSRRDAALATLEGVGLASRTGSVWTLM